MRGVWLFLLAVVLAGGWAWFRARQDSGAEARARSAATDSAWVEEGPAWAPQPLGGTNPDHDPPGSSPDPFRAPRPEQQAHGRRAAPESVPEPAPDSVSQEVRASEGAIPSPVPSIERLPEGGLLLDGRFLVRGRGTQEDPLRVPWELLRATQETFDPSLDRHDLPSRVTVLSGQVVRLTGYFATASGEEQTRELLLMFNKWDGCCLGLPPTPYDAVEVKLTGPVALRGKHMIRYGTITGRFSCDPFLVAGWLVGLYRMEDATLDWGG